MTKQDKIAIRRFVAIRDVYPGVLPMKEMIRLCFEASAQDFNKAIRKLKKEASAKQTV